jgi:hypothetical protein
MTIERRPSRAGLRELRAGLAALGLWALALPTVPLLLPPDEPILVVVPDRTFPVLLDGEVTLVGRAGPFWQLRGDAAELYGAGAWLVLPSPRTGCLGWRKPPRP